MSRSHQAAWLDGASQKLRIAPIDTVAPGEGQVVIKSRAIAINPVDWKIQDTGMMIQQWPCMLGEDVAGEVVEVGSNVKRFQKGQRVIAHCLGLMTAKTNDASFQEYVTTHEANIIPIPDSMTFETASVLPLGVSTAAHGLFAAEQMNLSPIRPGESTSTGQVVVVWGGSSSVGASAIQLAKAAGYEVFTTASARNSESCKRLGAAQVFDYTSTSVIGDIVATLSGRQFAGCYDAISTHDTQLQCAQIVAQLGGGILVLVLPPTDAIPATVKVVSVFAPKIFTSDKQVGKTVYEDFLPHALASGAFEAFPAAQVVGKGLEDLQKACDILKAGVSATKIVVSM